MIYATGNIHASLLPSLRPSLHEVPQLRTHEGADPLPPSELLQQISVFALEDTRVLES